MSATSSRNRSPHSLRHERALNAHERALPVVTMGGLLIRCGSVMSLPGLWTGRSCLIRLVTYGADIDAAASIKDRRQQAHKMFNVSLGISGPEPNVLAGGKPTDGRG